MKRSVLLLCCCAMVISCLGLGVALGQEEDRPVGNVPVEDQPIKVAPGTMLRQKPFHVSHSRKTQELATTGSTLPMWNYNTTSGVDSTAYSGVMVGQNPATSGTTTVPTVLIPVRLQFKYTRKTVWVFDPTASDSGCLGSGNTALSLTQQSPLFNNVDYNLGGTDVGNTQYIDAFRRADFWSDVSSNPNYHTLLGVATLGLQTVTIPSSSSGSPSGTVYNFSGLCGSNRGYTNHPGYLGVVDINYWDPIAQQLITQLGIPPGTLPIFIFYNAVMSLGNAVTGQCCVLGYHSDMGSPTQTYAVAEFEGRDQTLFWGTSDITVMSHEIAEWMDDPLGGNPTPAWGHIGQVSGCQTNLEVGDPLTGTLFPSITMSNGFTYHPQELAFYSWFYREASGVNGWFSNNNSFAGDAGSVCQ